MNTKTWLLGGAAAVILLGAGFGIGKLTGGAPAPAVAEEAHGHEEEEGEAHAEGLVALTAAQIRASGIGVVAVGRGGGMETQISGRVEPAVDARAVVAASVSGRIERVLVTPGQTVRAGQALASVVSGDAAGLVAEADAARAEAEAARQAHQRDESLAAQGVVARQDVEASNARRLSAEAAARAARARAAAAGSPNAAGRVSIVSPIGGVVTAVLIGPGGFAAQGGPVAEVSDPARVELVFQAPAALAATVRTGMPVRVQTPGGELGAVVSGVAPAGAGGAAVIRARGAGLPPSGSAVTGFVVTGESGGLTVPAEAVQTVEGGSVVFVAVAGGFQATPVLVGRQAAGRTEIVRGLTGDERIAGANAFLLKAELAKGEAEHEH